MNSIQQGRCVADMMAGAWRARAGTVRADQIGTIGDRLQNEGLSGLIWNRLSATARRTPLARQIREHAIANAVAAARLDDILVRVVAAFRTAGIEPIVTKGWAVARYYTSPGIRPYSDLDVAVRPDQAAMARDVLNNFGNGSPSVDLHAGIADLGPSHWNGVFARTRLAILNGVSVRVLAPEDQFRLLVAHLLRHFCHRPLNLVDIAAILESDQIENWDACLRGTHTWRRWILAVAALARRLLGVHLPTQLADAMRAPTWLEDATLWHWGGGEELSWGTVASRPSEWRPAFAHGTLNMVRWSYRFGLPPMRLPQPIWAAAMLGRGLQPFNRLWRGVSRSRQSPQPFQTHTHPVF
jgi:hypothetical protein